MIHYDNVTKVFGSGPNAVTAVNDVTLVIEKGSLVTLLGPSGCGKTTLLRLTNRLIPLTSGKIKIDGRNIASQDPVKLRQSIGYAIQAIGLFPNKTIYENIATVPRLLKWGGEKIRNRVDELLTMLRLDPGTFQGRYPVELSGGQQQRIGVARCLAADPDLLLMDEPFGAIDPINREEIQNEFLRVQETLKKTIVFVTHDIHEAIKMGDKIAIFQEGRIVQYDTPEVILTRPKNKYIADFVGTDRTLKVLGLLRVKDVVNKNPPNIVRATKKAPEILKILEQSDSRHAVVVDGGKPLGYVTGKRLVHQDGTVADAVEGRPKYVEPQDSLKDALSTMLMCNMRVVGVVDGNGDLLGTLHMNDIQNAVLGIHGGEGPT